MPKLELQLPEDTLYLAQQSAEAEHTSLEQWVAYAIQRTATPSAQDKILGLFSDIPELMDAVVEDAMMAREQGIVRTSYE